MYIMCLMEAWIWMLQKSLDVPVILIDGLLVINLDNEENVTDHMTMPPINLSP